MKKKKIAMMIGACIFLFGIAIIVFGMFYQSSNTPKEKAGEEIPNENQIEQTTIAEDVVEDSSTRYSCLMSSPISQVNPDGISYIYKSSYDFEVIQDTDEIYHVIGNYVKSFQLNSKEDYNNFNVEYFKGESQEFKTEKEESTNTYKLIREMSMLDDDMNISSFDIESYLNKVESSGFQKCEKIQ